MSSNNIDVGKTFNKFASDFSQVGVRDDWIGWTKENKYEHHK